MAKTDSTEKKEKVDRRKGMPHLYKKGQSGNPAGRPKGSISIMGRVKQIFEEDPILFESYVRNVIKDGMLRRELIHQIDGKPKERLELSGALRFGDLEQLDNDELSRLAGEG